jgi:opacity protein-like surface antigen
MKKYAIVSLLMMTWVVRAHANLEKGDQLLAVQGGVSVPLTELDYNAAGGTKDTFADPGGSFGVQYLYQVLPMLGLGLDLANSSYSDRFSNILIFNASSVSGGHSFDVLPVVHVAFIPESRVHPFVEGGIGVSNTALKIEATPDAGHVWANTGTREKRTLIDSTKSGAAIMMGGGVDFFITDHLFLGASGRFLFYAKRTYDATDLGNQSGFGPVDGTLATFNSLFRLGWKF